jgi:methionine aminopeptidase
MNNNISVILDKYNAAARIAKKVYNELITRIKEGERNVKSLSNIGEEMITSECEKIYKKEKNKGVGFPVSISLNNCVGNYVYDDNNVDFNIIKDTDLIKIEIGVNIGGCIAMYGDSVTLNTEETDNIELLEDLQKIIVRLMKAGETNDEVRINIESKCAEHELIPIENSVNYQQLDGQLKTSESKYIIFNHKKYYDMEDNLVVEPNDCYEFEEGEVYTIKLSVMKESENVKYRREHKSQIYRFNDFFYNLKLKSSREFLSNVKSKVGNNAFVLSKFVKTSKDKMGLKECLESGILEEYPIQFVDSNVYTKVFTVLVLKDKGYLIV